MPKCVSTDSYFVTHEKCSGEQPTLELWKASDRVGVRVREGFGEDAIMYLTESQAKKLRAWLKNVS